MTIRTLLGVTLIAAFGFGLIVAVQQTNVWRYRYFRAERRLMAAESQLKLRGVARRPDGVARLQRFLFEAVLEGSDFSNVSIKAGASAFQKTWLVNADLENANIVAGGASFQRATFDHANLHGAQLAGGTSSFQLASFAGADLQGATLTGGDASFQGASFRDADLTGASIKCPANGSAFQAVDLNSAKFERADISAISTGDLESCYFSEPPTYNEKTRFPSGFDPAVAGWKRQP